MHVMEKVQVRWLIRRDLSAVCEIEKECFEFPWSEEDFLRPLRQQHIIGMVAERGEKIVGYMIYELRKNSIYVLNLAVHPSQRLRGIGTQLVDKLKSKLSSHRRSRLTLHTRESNLTAQMFFRGQYFKATLVERGFYDDTDEDAYLMEYRFMEESDADSNE